MVRLCVELTEHEALSNLLGERLFPTDAELDSDDALEGLRVADASIMPDCIRANTNVTTMMIGERVADFIRQGM